MLHILIKWSKTLESRNVVKVIKIPSLGSNSICPVNAIKNLLEVADIEQRSACGKLSSLSLPKNVDSDHDSDSSSDESLVLSLNHLKSAKYIQRQVDSQLRELEECSFSPKGKKQKIKSKEVVALMSLLAKEYLGLMILS